VVAGFSAGRRRRRAADPRIRRPAGLTARRDGG